MTLSQDTIVAQATPPGRGGVGIVRVSGPLAQAISERLLSARLKPREASYLDFQDHEGTVIDRGIALWFPGPHSFTGEDVLELQGHGGPVVMDLLIRSILACGARVARPGEFSERAFINDKLDLAQAEAIADLIDASSEQAAKSAVRSLQGEFSRRIGELLEQLIRLRIHVEAAIDFPEEEIDFLSDGKIAAELGLVIDAVEQLQREALQGAILREGMRVVIAGKPNAGKSSLLNALAGRESAIVTEIPGTTRDVLREQIHIDGMPLHIIDTAGLRDSTDAVEKIGIERAWQEIEQADRVLLVVDATDTDETDPGKLWPEYFAHQGRRAAVTLIRNKADLTGEASRIHQNRVTRISLSAAKGDGIELLREHLKQCMGFDTHLEGGFIARRRHLDAIGRCHVQLQAGRAQLEAGAGELLAEELTRAQLALAEITGEFTADDLLGRIFSSFCIGK